MTDNFASIINGNAKLNGVTVTNVSLYYSCYLYKQLNDIQFYQTVANANTLFAGGNRNAQAATNNGATTAATGRGGRGRNATNRNAATTNRN